MSIMETMGKQRRPLRSFSDEFKAEVVELRKTAGLA
jgi:transposase-like protein